MREEHLRAIDEHYGRHDVAAAILAAVQAAGKDPAALTADDLAAVDQFHTRGRDATLELAHLAGVTPTMRVLDVGGGLGGAARTLAHRFGCHVTVLDLTEEYCRAGVVLTARLGLADRVSFRHGDAVALPFADASFDLAWSQHSAMNVEDKARLYREIHRVLRPGGRLALHEIMAGPEAPVRFPVPWARTPATSFLRPAASIRALLGDQGFREVTWSDVSAPSLEWFRQRLAAGARAGTPPALGLHLLLGSDFSRMFGNLVRNLAEDRISVIAAVLDRT